MTDFIIKKLPCDLTFNAGLALVGRYFKRMDISARVDEKFPAGLGGIANSDILQSYLGLLVQGKNDFEAIEAFRGDDFFCRTLGIQRVPSCSTLRQRLDTHAPAQYDLVDACNLALLSARYAGQPVDFGVLLCGYMAVDWDTFVMNNSGPQKEGIGRTYQGVDGFTCSATYLGSLGFCLALALRLGVQHSARETEYNLERVLPMAAQLTPLPLLFRAYSGLRGWTTTLPQTYTMQDVIDLVCAMAAVAMNVLRLMGQNALIGPDAPVRHTTKRSRMKTVLQELMFKAGRMINHAGRWVLGLGANDSTYPVFERLYDQFAPKRERKPRPASCIV